jgi:nucleotide-binding universal stress UspA family protein
MEFPLVVGVDGSDASLDAVDWATDEAVRHGLPLRLVYGSLWEHYERIKPSFSPDRATEQVIAENIVASAAERARRRAPDLKVSAEVVGQDATTTLLDEGRKAFAVVTGNRGRGELTDRLLGSTSLTVAARALCPAIVVRGSWPGQDATAHRVVLGVGDTGEASEAAAFAFREAELRGAVLEAVRAWRHPEGATDEAVADREFDEALRAGAAEHPKVVVERRLVEGPARKALLAQAADADLLVVGARHRHGSFGLQLGAVNHGVLHHAPCPVAVVPQTS